MRPILLFSWMSLLSLMILTSAEAESSISSQTPSNRSKTVSTAPSALPTPTNASLLITQATNNTEASSTHSTSRSAVATTQDPVTPSTPTIPTTTPTKPAIAHTTAPKTSSPVDPHHASGNVKTVVILLVVVVVLILVLVLGFRWASRQSGPVGDRARGCSQGLQQRLMVVGAAIEGCLGLSLCPRKREQDEEAGDEQEEMTENNGEAGVGSRKVQVDNQREEEKDEEEDEEKKEDQGEDSGDSSDDYSSMEGVDLRERAKERQGEEDGDSEAEGETGGADGELSLVNLEETSERAEDKIQDNDLTVL